MPRPGLLSLVPALLLGACTDSSPPTEPQVERKVLTVRGSPELDLLFVIDSSPAMAAHQERLATSLPELIRGLETLEIGLPSLHLGVITSDIADGGRLRARVLQGTFLADVPAEDGSRLRNYTGELIDVFRALVAVGTAGDEIARPLETVRLALDDNPWNDGFRRPGAHLAIVFITANDDASPAPVAEYVAQLRGLTTEPSKLGIGIISGAAAGSLCGEAPAPRLHQVT